MSKDSFKVFVRSHPELIKYVNNNEMTWQKFYDMYDLYGEDNKVWDDYLNKNNNNVGSTGNKRQFKINDVINYIKSVDMDSLQKGISGMERAIGFIQDLGLVKGNNANIVNSYRPRPLYKSFED